MKCYLWLQHEIRKINFETLFINLIFKPVFCISKKLKKLIAVVLLAICLFNIGGQLVLHQYAVFLTARFFNEQTSKGLYNVNDLTEVKLPVNLPGISDWSAYENISGQIKFENSSYNYVKMKITRNAIYLMCIPDYATTSLTSQNIIDAKQVKDIPVPKKEHVPYSKSSVRDNFSFAFLHFRFSSPVQGLAGIDVRSCPLIIHHSPDIPEQPPKFLC
ncbi:MAG TPA: hypothetical protein DCO83_02845 [Mucilaginibacter sp.]|jgi:hypothetical protein|nr:hypothetical protein [Mucilaginibacter sp.]